MAVPTVSSASVTTAGSVLKLVWSEAVLVVVNEPMACVYVSDGRRMCSATQTALDPADGTNKTTLTTLQGNVYASQTATYDFPAGAVNSVSTGNGNAAIVRGTATNNSTATRTTLNGHAQMMTDIIRAFGVPVTLRRVVVGAFNTSTGQRATTTNDYSVSAQRGGMREGRISAGAGSSDVRERLYVVNRADVTGLNIANEGWQLVDEGVEYEITDVDRSVDDDSMDLTVRRLV